MPILPSVQHYITSEETEFEAPVSESVAQNYGEAINYLNDLFTGNYVEFTASGTWVVPASVTKVVFFGCGGGGGGGGGGGNSTASSGLGGGSGGAGSTPVIFHSKVIPGDLISITIGAGGIGGAGGAASFATNGADGTNGGDTTVVGTGINLKFLGAAKGKGNTVGTGGAQATNYAISNISGFLSAGAGGAGGNATVSGPGNGQPGGAAYITPYAGTPATGGAGGAVNSPYLAGGGGGAGGSGIGKGGNGGMGGRVTPSDGEAATNYGAGGGGGGGCTGPNLAGRAGGNGKSGYLLISWF